MRTVANLKPGQAGVIKGYNDNLVSLKLMEMGCLPGICVKVNFTAPFGDPIALDVAGYNLSLRLAEAANILIEEE
jgi:ferrous iron transport protein A